MTYNRKRKDGQWVWLLHGQSIDSFILNFYAQPDTNDIDKRKYGRMWTYTAKLTDKKGDLGYFNKESDEEMPIKNYAYLEKGQKNW